MTDEADKKMSELLDRQRWEEDAVTYLRDLSTEDVIDAVRNLVLLDDGGLVYDRFTTALRRFCVEDPVFALALAGELINDELLSVRLESYPILKPLMFSSAEARGMVWDEMLADPEMSEHIYEWALEDFAGSQEEPLEGIVYAAEALAKIKRTKQNQSAHR